MRLLRGLALCATLVAGPALAGPAPTVGIIKDPDWVQKPNGEQLWYAYPKAAQWLSLEGEAKLQCDVTELGRLTRCTAEDGPAGLGFAQAALGLVPYFQMAPKRVDGRPIAGGQVTVPIKFRLPPSKTDRAAAAVPSPGNLVLARRLAEVMQTKEALLESFRAWLAHDSLEMRELRRDPNFKEAAAAWTAAVEAGAQRRLDLAAEVYATMYSEAEMNGIVAFLQSPAGRAYIEKGRAADKALAERTPALIESFGEAAKLRFCARRECELSSTAAAEDKPVLKP